MASQYITVRETAQILGVSEKKVTDLIQAGTLQAYRIADQFLRLKRAEVLQLKGTSTVVTETVQYDYTIGDRIKDFFFFNDFYIVALCVAFVLLYFIFFTG